MAAYARPAARRIQVTAREVVADVWPYGADPSGIRAHRRNVIEAYAAALSSDVETRALTTGERHYATSGRIGPCEGAREPRTMMRVEARIQGAATGTGT